MGVALLGPSHSCPPHLSTTLKKRQEQLGISSDQFTELNHMISHMSVTRSMPNAHTSPYGRPHPPSTPRSQFTTNMQIRTRRIITRPQVRQFSLILILWYPQTAPGTSLYSEDKLHTNVHMSFEYLGGGVRLSSGSDPRACVEVYQQHCGGNNIRLYTGKLLAQGILY